MKQKNIFMRWLDKRRPLSLLFLLSLLMSSSLEVMADGAKWYLRTDDANYDSYNLSKNKGWVELYLYVFEDDGDKSYWYDDPAIIVDGDTIAKFSQLNIPTAIASRNKNCRDDNNNSYIPSNFK